MIAWLRRSMQTRTSVFDAASMQQERETGFSLAKNNTVSILLLTQLLLFVTLTAYDAAGDQTWLYALLLPAPAALLLLLWHLTDFRLLSGKRSWPLLLLLPNLAVDVSYCMFAAASLLENFIPSIPAFSRLLAVFLFPLLTLWLSRENGVPYGLYPLRYLLPILFLLSTVLSGADAALWRLEKVQLPDTKPFLQGLWVCAGASWPICLLFTSRPPVSLSLHKKPHRALFWLVPIVLCFIWALWMCMLRPWMPGDLLQPGQKLTSISQYSGSMFLCEMGTFFWTSLLPASLAGSLYFGQHLLKTTFPAFPRPLCPLLLLLPGFVLLLLPGSSVSFLMKWLLPFRFLFAVLAGVLAVFLSKKEKSK